MKKLETFEECLAELLRIEDNYSDEPDDSGGPSRFGITHTLARAHGYEGPMCLFPLAKARNIYLSQYWLPIEADRLPIEVRYILFDSAVNHGVYQAVLWLQRALDVAQDGIVGPQTLAAALAADPAQVKANVLAERLVFMASLPQWPMFSRGWARRMAEMMFAGERPKWH
jgi:lysozyme family protein